MVELDVDDEGCWLRAQASSGGTSDSGSETGEEGSGRRGAVVREPSSLIKNRLGKKLRLITLMHTQYSIIRNIYHSDPQNALHIYFDSPP